MIGRILIGKVITGIAYSLIGSETARKALTVESIHKAASAVGRTAAATGRAVKDSISKGKVAVQQRKEKL